MINSLFISKTGMEAQQTQLDVISHNLANVSTTGYKRASAVFEDLIYQNLRQSGAQTTEQNQLPTGLHLGLGVRTVATSRNFLQGPCSNRTMRWTWPSTAMDSSRSTCPTAPRPIPATAPSRSMPRASS